MEILTGIIRGYTEEKVENALTRNSSLQYQNNIKQTSDENEEMYQLGDVFDNPIPTSIIRIEWHTVKGITNDILGAKGLRSITPGKFIQSACNLHNIII